MVSQNPNPAQANGSPASTSPNAPSNSSSALSNDPIFTAIHNAFLLGWSIMELKSRVQITACNLALDAIIFNQQSSSLVASINLPLAGDSTGNQQPDVIDALLKNIVLKDVTTVLPQFTVNGSKELSTKVQSLSSELRDNAWLTSVMREIFRRIVTLHLQRFPDSDTSDTIYDINPPTPSDQAASDFPYLYLYPGKFDYANVGISIIKPSVTGNDTVTPFVQKFRLYDVTRRALNCLTLLWTAPEEALDPATIECYQKRLVPGVLTVPTATTTPASSSNVNDQPVLEEKSCDELPVPPDAQVKEAIKVLSSLVIRLLEAWDSFLRESFYSDADSPSNEIELIAYEAGRSLAALTWGVSVALVPLENSLQLTPAQQQNSALVDVLTNKVRNIWVNVFNERDVDSLQLRITALSKALDKISGSANKNTNQPGANGVPVSPDIRMPGQAIQAVSSSLEYWQRAVTQMCLPASTIRTVKPLLTPTSATSHPQTGNGEPLLPVNWGNSAKALRLALIKQSYVWRALILGQRDLQSFNIDSVSQKILNDFMQELEHATSNEFRKIRKRGINLFLIIMIVGLIVLVLVIAGALVPQIRALNNGQITNPLTLIVLLWGAAAAFVSSVMGKLSDALSRFGPAGTAVAESFERGYEGILLEFDYLDHNVAVTYPLIEFFALADFKVSVENPNGEKVVTAIKDGYDFLVYVFWTKEDREDEIKQVARAAFGPIGAFVGTELGLEQVPKSGRSQGGTQPRKIISNPKPKG